MIDKLYIIKAVYMVVHDFAQDLEKDFIDMGYSVHKALEPQNLIEMDKAFDEIIEDVKANGTNPMLHIDGHGCCQYFQLYQAITINWAYLARKFGQLNQAANGNLVITMSVCYGLSVWNVCKQMNIKPFKVLICANGDMLGRNAYWRMLAFYKEWIKTHDPNLSYTAFDNEQTGVGNNFRMIV